MPQNSQQSCQPFLDLFRDDLPQGKVIGSQVSPGGMPRRGLDVEGVMQIDHGALRIQPLAQPGWGRCALAYGPYPRQNGLAVAVMLLNGHNTAQTGEKLDPLPRQIKRWLRGTEAQTTGQRVKWLLKNGHKKGLPRHFQRWLWLYTHKNEPGIDENLAVGWFPSPVSGGDCPTGSAFTMHATGSENGELWARVSDHQLAAVRGVQNLPVYYLVILRERGAAYYAASLPGAHGLPAYPDFRPLAIDPFQQDAEVYAGVQQSVMGQIGFRVDSRIYGVQVEPFPEYAAWYGTAHAADSLSGTGVLEDSPAEMGGAWQVLRGHFTRSTEGTLGVEQANLAVLTPRQPCGLIHALVQVKAWPGGEVGLAWRVQDEANQWQIRLEVSGVHLRQCREGEWTEIATEKMKLTPGREYSLQILDDGQQFSLHLDGKMLFERRFEDPANQQALGVGIAAYGPVVEGWRSGGSIRSFEAHPRVIPAPAGLKLPCPWQPNSGPTLMRDDFSGPFGELSGHVEPISGKSWCKEFGPGTFNKTGSGGTQVQGSANSPNPGRTAYTLDWNQPDYADLSVNILPPGTERGQWEKGRAGLIFWQDAENYITVGTWLDDFYAGASISSFYLLNGFEELYDAVWSNVGKRVTWGKQYRLRVVFDGLNFLTFVDEEPVLFRSLTDVYPHMPRLAIRKVGIVVNWEWGNDTGSQFLTFEAKGRLPKLGALDE